MYEDQTFEVILQRMLDQVSNTLDKREGSIIYDALAPAAAELAQAYIEIDSLIKETYAGTASRTFLIKRAAEQGITPYAASKAVLKGLFYDASDQLFDVPIGSRFNLESLNYEVTEKINTGTFKVECETAGTIGNSQLGTLTPIEYIAGLKTAELSEILIQGEDEESTEELRTRYFNEVGLKVQDGNVAQYLAWAAAYSGIGKTKVFPLWNGANTVKVSILNTSQRAATQTLIDQFQAYLDPNSEGLGNGKAPIGAVVTVSTATEVTIDVAMEIELAAGYPEATGIQEAIEAYFADIAYSKTTVGYLTLAGKVADVPCVDLLSSMTMNLGTSDITLTAEQVPVLGTLNVTVV